MYWSRVWKPAIRFSRRSSIQATEPLNRRAGQTSTIYSGVSDIFWPKPPPTSGATTRRSHSGMPSTSAIAVRVMCGIWVVQVSVTRPVRHVEGGVAAARFDRRRVLAARARFDLDDRAAFRGLVEALGLELALDQDVAGAAAWTSAAPCFKRIDCIDHGVVPVNFEDDLIGDVLRLLAARRDHRGNRLAGEGDDAVTARTGCSTGTSSADGGAAADAADAGEIRRRDHHGPVRRVDAEDAAAGDRAADEAHASAGRASAVNQPSPERSARSSLRGRRTPDPGHAGAARLMCRLFQRAAHHRATSSDLYSASVVGYRRTARRRHAPRWRRRGRGHRPAPRRPAAASAWLAAGHRLVAADAERAARMTPRRRGMRRATAETMAKSPARRLNSTKPQRRVRRRAAAGDFGHQSRRRGIIGREDRLRNQSSRLHHAVAAGAPHHDPPHRARRRALHHSAAGSASAIDPPKACRVHGSGRCAMLWATTGRSFASGPDATGVVEDPAWRVSAPIREGARPPRGCRPARWMRVDVDQDQRAAPGENSSPAPRSGRPPAPRASLPATSPRIVTASATVRGTCRVNGAGFMRQNAR